MNVDGIVVELDGEISKLQVVRNLLAGTAAVSGKGKQTSTPGPANRKPRKLSAGARAKISAAQKKRWAKTKSAKKA